MHRHARLLAVLVGFAPLLAAAAPPPGRQARVCATCHKTAEPGTLRGHFDDVAMKSRSVQMKIDSDVEVLVFDPASLKVVNSPETGDVEKMLKGVKKGGEVLVAYTLDGNVKRMTQLSLKPKLKVPADKQVTTEQMEKLVAQGPAKGKYVLFDARPAPKYAEGYIPTAGSLPYPAFEKEKGKLPADKAALVIFYCAGPTCAMSPAARDATEALGYTNAKTYHDGIPGWSRTNALALSPRLLKEAWLDKQQPLIVLDARANPAGGTIAGAFAFPDASKAATDKLYKFRKMKPPIVVFDEDGSSSAPAVARGIVAAGHPAMVLTGGVKAWTEAGYALVQGSPAVEITYVPKPKPGEISLADFRGILAAPAPDVLVLDVRNPDEVKAGAFAGSLNIPAEQVASRLGEIPKDRKIVVHCSTGLRAEMTYNLLKGAGYPRVSFYNGAVEFEDGKPDFGD